MIFNETKVSRTSQVPMISCKVNVTNIQIDVGLYLGLEKWGKNLRPCQGEKFFLAPIPIIGCGRIKDILKQWTLAQAMSDPFLAASTAKYW